MKIIRTVRNWYVVPLVYYRLFRRASFVLRLRNGERLKLRTNSTDIQAFVNVWIMDEYKMKDFDIKDDNIVVDVGAHIGLFTIYASRFCKKGKILAFEPIKENYETLLENLKLNNLENVLAHNLAVSNKNTPVKIYLNISDQAAHTIYGTGQNFVEVNSITLREIIDSKCNRVDLVKLDCEGAEYDILGALPTEYFERIDRIRMEYHRIGDDFADLGKLKIDLQKSGFKIVDRPANQSYGLLFANKH